MELSTFSLIISQNCIHTPIWMLGNKQLLCIGPKNNKINDQKSNRVDASAKVNLATTPGEEKRVY